MFLEPRSCDAVCGLRKTENLGEDWL